MTIAARWPANSLPQKSHAFLPIAQGLIWRSTKLLSIAGAIDYSLNSWTALTRHLEDGAVPIEPPSGTRLRSSFSQTSNSFHSGRVS